MEQTVLPVFLFVACALGLALGLLTVAGLFNRGRSGRVTRMPYESGMDPIHDTRRRFDVRFYLLAIAFLVFDVELLFLYPWAVAEGRGARGEERGVGIPVSAGLDATNSGVPGADRDTLDQRHISRSALRTPYSSSLAPRPPSLAPLGNRHLIFAAVMAFVALLTAGFIYDWRKGVFQWR
jgi:NADH-quinone oxidoreductase subunit A